MTYLILTEGFDVVVYNTISTNFTVTSSKQFRTFLTQAFL